MANLILQNIDWKCLLKWYIACKGLRGNTTESANKMLQIGLEKLFISLGST